MNEDSQWNSNRDQNPGKSYSGRKQSGHKYDDNKGSRYSPSTSYNYNQNGHMRGQGQSYQQHPRRRIDRYKRESIGSSDRLVKQNDIIIKLLKEIRDRLPKPVQIPVNTEDNEIKNGAQVSESTNDVEVSVESEKASESDASVSDGDADLSLPSESEKNISDTSDK